MSERTKKANEAEIAAVTEVVRAYYDGTMAGDEAARIRHALRLYRIVPAKR